jgi:hypothetical protein
LYLCLLTPDASSANIFEQQDFTLAWCNEQLTQFFLVVYFFQTERIQTFVSYASAKAVLNFPVPRGPEERWPR